METIIPEKAALLKRLEKGGFNVPEFIYVSAVDFKNENFKALEAFLDRHRESFKVIARSAHLKEEFFKGGTFDSLEIYADLGGIKYARKKIINLAKTAKQLSIRRQQIFSNAPDIDLENMGMIVMPFISGTSVMAKMIGNRWEFGYCRDRSHKIQREPYITRTPHDISLLKLSEDIQKYLGYPCEIEFVISEHGEIYVVQAKDISDIETIELKLGERAIHLDGVRRVRRNHNFRERPVYVMDNKTFYLNIINKCEEFILGNGDSKPTLEEILEIITLYQAELEAFALKHHRFCVLGLSIQEPEELYQIANHYLDDYPDMQAQLSRALHDNLYKIDYFLSETDTLIAKDKFRLNLCGHDAYGIDTVRNPMWSVFWQMDKHEKMVKRFKKSGFKTGDIVGIEIDSDEKPIVYRL
ncbi:MAG: hypothetical protein JRF17_06405 [Deltaproteobacteria bacterium]|jgi:hypothetical protein|nr:hypothetical protein [Deltaproteobacteria bacterium]